MATKLKAKPKAKKKVVKLLTGRQIVDNVAKLDYDERDHLVKHLTDANRIDAETRSLGQAPDGKHYGEYKDFVRPEA